MKQLRETRRPRLATILAALALMIALGGTATAAGLINGGKLKNKSVAGKKLKNKTITKNKLAPKTIKALKGKQGAKGPQGPKGDQGAPGANGVVAPIYAEYDSKNLPVNTELAIGTTSVPAGKYMVTAAANVFSSGTAIVGCGIDANNDGGNSSAATWSSPVANSRTTLPLQMITESSEVTKFTLICHPGTSNGAASGNLVITPIQ